MYLSFATLQNPKHQKFWRELENTGRLNTELINYVFTKKLNCDHVATECECQAKKDILHMMQYFGLIAPIIPSEQKTGYCYLVPSHLSSSGEKELKKCYPSTNEPCPLYVRFQDGFIPHGLYFQLICKWCSMCGSQQQQELFQKEPKLFRNAAKFVLDNNFKVIMTVVCCKSTIKVCLHSQCEDKTNVDFKAAEIKNLIRESLDSMREKCTWYRGLKYELCARCPLCADGTTKDNKVERRPFADDDCLHPLETKNDQEMYCKEEMEWSEVPGLKYWNSKPTVSLSLILSLRKRRPLTYFVMSVLSIGKPLGACL